MIDMQDNIVEKIEVPLLNPTDLMQSILQSSEARKMIQFVAPVFGESYVALWLFEIIGRELDDMEDWAMDIFNQCHIQTATWSMPEWEKQYGITPESDWDLDTRRNAVLNKILFRSPMTKEKMEQLASSLTGVPVEIIENTGKNKFSVYVRSNTSVKKFEAAKTYIDRAKPAHLIYDINIASLNTADAKIYIGCASTNHIVHYLEV